MSLKMFSYDRIVSEYNRKAREYDKYCEIVDTGYGYVERMRRECIFSLIKGIKKKKILEVGCGTGYYLVILSENKCFGIDISKKMLKQCKMKYFKNIFLGNGAHLMFKDNTFDIILCVNTFQYFPEPIKSLTEMNRVLKESGEVILTSVNWIAPRIIPHKIFKAFQREKNLERRYTIFTLKRMFHEAGFELEEMTGFNFLPFKSDHKQRSRKMLNIFEKFEQKIRNTSFKYFANEFAIKLKRM